MKRAFTLVEMLIVVALIATLMSIVLRLTSVGADESNRNTTIVRLSRLENCLSGYYAAFGSYPPVKLHNSRDIEAPVNSTGINDDSEPSVELWGWDPKKFRQGVSQDAEKKAWNQVMSACKSQPVALESPDPDADGLDEAFRNLANVVWGNKTRGDYVNYLNDPSDPNYHAWKNGFSSIYANLGGISDGKTWREAQICKFGLMSYLLPRFQAMMGWRRNMFDGSGDCIFQQWNDNNGKAPHDPYTGEELTWKKINDKILEARQSDGNAKKKALAYLEALPTESVTARWLVNLVGICTGDMTDLNYYGISICDNNSGGMFSVQSGKDAAPPSIKVYAPDPSNPTRNLYHLSQITVNDGWGQEFFYYSATPYQSYRLWSAGKNGRTFPPWISRNSLESSTAKECVAAWTEDDIGGMTN